LSRVKRHNIADKLLTGANIAYSCQYGKIDRTGVLMDGEIIDKELRTLEDGRQVWFYAEGPVELRDVKTGQIVAARGHLEPAEALALNRRRWAAVEAAKWDGLAAAALQTGLATDDLSAAAIAAIVKRLAVSAAGGDGRAANDAARIVLQLVGLLAGPHGARTGDGGGGPVAADGLQVTVGAELAERLMLAMAEIRRDRRQVPDGGAGPSGGGAVSAPVGGGPPTSAHGAPAVGSDAAADMRPADMPLAAADSSSSPPTGNDTGARTHMDTQTADDTTDQIITPHPTLPTSQHLT
jgi:hypothetical protein